MKTVLIAGPYGSNNLGDEFILSQIASSIRSLGHRVIATSRDPSSTAKIHGVEAVERLDIRLRKMSALTLIKDVDVVVIGGGEQIAEGRMTRGYPLWGLLPNVAHYIRRARQLSKQSMLWSVGVDPINSLFGRQMIGRYVSKANTVTVRDHRSLERLRALGVTSDLHLAADPVWSLKRRNRPQAKSRARELLGIPEHAGPVILLAPANDNMVSLNYLEALTAGARLAAARTGSIVVLLRMHQQDRFDNRLLLRAECAPDGSFRHAPDLVFEPEDIADVFCGVDVVVSSRMHALILAATQGTPWVNISRGSKMDALGEMFSLNPLSTSSLTGEAVTAELTRVTSMEREAWQDATDPRLVALSQLADVSRVQFECLTEA